MVRSTNSFQLDPASRKELVRWVTAALGSTHSNEFEPKHVWIFQFIDILYVAIIFKISNLIKLCGRGADVYLLCFSYFSIMFCTRLAFDVYTCVSQASGVLHVVAFCLYGLGVFVMLTNI